jgi:hypothetical protein
LIVGAYLGSITWARTEHASEKHPFTVQDSIEIAYIINPVATTIIEIRDTQPLGSPIFSPDHKHFLLITQRGILKENHLEATIWLFDQNAACPRQV